MCKPLCLCILFIFDPLFIFGLMGFPTLGIRGAAIATVFGQCVSAVVAIALNHAHNPTVKPIRKNYRPERAIFAAIYIVGLPTIITQAMGSVMVSLFMPMNGLGVGLVNMLSTVIRQFAVLIPLAYLFARYFGSGTVWFSLWAAEIIDMLYAIWHSHHILKTKEII